MLVGGTERPNAGGWHRTARLSVGGTERSNVGGWHRMPKVSVARLRLKWLRRGRVARNGSDVGGWHRTAECWWVGMLVGGTECPAGRMLVGGTVCRLRPEWLRRRAGGTDCLAGTVVLGSRDYRRANAVEQLGRELNLHASISGKQGDDGLISYP